MSSNDPSDFVRNPPSVIVKIQNTSQDAMNGLLGVVLQFSSERGRYVVLLTATQQAVSIKPENLAKAGYVEQLRAQYQNIANNREIRRELSRYYDMAI